MRDLSTASGAHGARRRHWRLYVIGYGIVLTLLGEPISAGERLELESFSAYPPQPKIQVDLDDGSTCSVTDRAPPTLVLYGRQLNSLDQAIGNPSGSKNDIGGGIALMLPLGGTGIKKTCNGLLKLQEARAKLALANQMLEAGQINDNDMKKIVERLRATLGI